MHTGFFTIPQKLFLGLLNYKCQEVVGFVGE